MDKTREKAVQTAAFLSLNDGLDRFNTLFLEIRQLQTTLVHQLRLPDLLLPLRYEELFLWGTMPPRESTTGTRSHPEQIDRHGILSAPDSWVDVLSRTQDVHADSSLMARCWIPRFPHPRDNDAKRSDVEFDANRLAPDHPLHNSLHRAHADSLEITDRVGRIMRSASRRGFLTAELRRLYHLLTALQVLKQNLLREKIVLVFYGLLAFGHLRGNLSDARLRDSNLHLLMACVAVRYQLAQRVISLRNLQREIEQIVDAAFDQDPRPTAARRRDQGMFSLAISKRPASPWL